MRSPIRIVVSVVTLLLIHLVSFSQSLKGKVSDVSSNEPLVGANVLVVETGQKGYVQLDGYFRINSIRPGKYSLVISFTGYETKTIPVTIALSQANMIEVTMKTSSKELTAVSVTSNSKAESNARSLEKNAAQLLNVVSSRAIELSPDITAGNVLQRVSGVSVQRSSSGDGQYTIIRGLDSRYNYTSIDGIILPSPDATQRSVPLDMFPADLIKRIEVVKSLTPDIEANAIGGATNLVMKDGPEKLAISANLSIGGSSVFTDRAFSGFSRKDMNFRSPTEVHGSQYIAKLSDLPTSQLNFHKVQYPVNLVGGFSIGNRFLKDKLGYMIGGSYIREYRGGNTLYYQGLGANDNPPNTPAFQDVQNRQYNFLQSRLGLQAKLNYILTPDHYFDLYGLFLQLDNNQYSHIDLNGLGGTGEVDYFDHVTFDRKNMTHISLTGHDKITKTIQADWILAWSSAGAKTPDQVNLETYRENSSAKALYLSNLPNQWSHSQDNDKSAYLNLKYTPGKKVEFTAGGMYRYKNRSAYYNHYLLSSAVANSPKQQFTTIDQAQFSFIPYPAAAHGDTTNENNYGAHETVSAAYVEAKLLFFDKLQVIAGVREETTTQDYTSLISPALPGKTGNFNYTDILPGLHLKYSLTDKQNLRLSYFAGISRPTLYDLIPSSNATDQSALYTTSGNYNLKHSTADNIDFRYDNFFSATTYLLVGAFYKRIKNPIEYSTFTLNGTPVTQNNVDVRYGPTNPTADATNYGFELVFSKFFGKFGVEGNYSYTHSTVTTLKEILGNNNGSPVVIFVNQSRPLQGQADHIGNLSFLFKDSKSGFDAQVSFVYTGRRISVVSPFLGLDTWQRAGTQLDLSLEKRIDKQFFVFFKATNLLNNRLYQDILHSNNLIGYPGGLKGQTDPNRILIQQDEFKQTVLLGFRYKL